MHSTRLIPWVMLALTTTLATSLAGEPLPVIMKNGQAHVAAGVMEREMGIVIKRLPGREEFVACGTEQCAPLRSVIREGDTLLVPIAGLSEALNLTANFDENRQHVALVPAPSKSAGASGVARLGSIAPNLRLTKLDGTSVTLDELRGQRVLVNSWASW